MKSVLIVIGIFIGLILCLLEGVISYSDTASLDQEFGIEVVSWKFFILKIILYSFLGGITGFLCYKIINYFKKK